MAEDEDKKTDPQWEHREFAIHKQLKEVCELSITATEAEIEALRKKIKKLQYGG